jgi:hypothetical protein
MCCYLIQYKLHRRNGILNRLRNYRDNLTLLLIFFFFQKTDDDPPKKVFLLVRSWNNGKNKQVVQIDKNHPSLRKVSFNVFKQGYVSTIFKFHLN